jgi:hypothetical protein
VVSPQVITFGAAQVSYIGRHTYKRTPEKCQFLRSDIGLTCFGCRNCYPRNCYNQREGSGQIRLYRDWTWGEIHRTFFSSVSIDAVKKAYSRVPPEARMHRASILVSLIANSRNTSGVSWSTHHSTLMHLYTRQEPYQPSRPAPSPSQTKSTIETIALTTPTTGDMNESTSNGDSRSRYRLRQKRPADFRKSRLQYSAGHQRFAHLSRAYEEHHELLKAPDGDYEPPSHLPTPTLSDCSTLITSNRLNDASSVCSNESEYFSAEEFHHGLHCEVERRV